MKETKEEPMGVSSISTSSRTHEYVYQGCPQADPSVGMFPGRTDSVFDCFHSVHRCNGPTSPVFPDIVVSSAEIQFKIQTQPPRVNGHDIWDGK